MIKVILNQKTIHLNDVKKTSTIYVHDKENNNRVGQVVCFEEINEDWDEEVDLPENSYFSNYFVPESSYGKFLIGPQSKLQDLLIEGHLKGYEFYIDE